MPAVRGRKPLEKDIENAFVRKVKQLGCITRKINGMGFNAWPDRLILCPGGATLFIEFKRPGETLAPLQDALHSDVKAMGHTWYVCDSWENALSIVHEHIKQ